MAASTTSTPSRRRKKPRRLFAGLAGAPAWVSAGVEGWLDMGQASGMIGRGGGGGIGRRRGRRHRVGVARLVTATERGQQLHRQIDLLRLQRGQALFGL